MPLVRIKDVAAMTTEERAAKLLDLRVELARMKTMINAGGAVEDPTRIRLLRKAIAQILTVENEQRLGIREKPKETEKKPEKPAKKAKAEKKEAQETEETAPQ
jgi:large subunit ribosomal protein L29